MDVDARLPTWVPELFDTLNKLHFEGHLLRPKRLGYLRSAKYNAMYVPTVQFIMFDSDPLVSRERCADTLLHEMVHLALEQRDGDHCRDHGEAFAEMATNIGTKQGWEPVRPGTKEAGLWPQLSR